VKYTRDEYVYGWSKWDSIFSPSYSIITIDTSERMVIAEVQKKDRRIRFFMSEPYHTKETVILREGKVFSVKSEYLNSNEDL